MRDVQVVTVNDYLARRDSEWVGQVPRFLGLKVRLARSAQYGAVTHMHMRKLGRQSRQRSCGTSLRHVKSETCECTRDAVKWSTP